MRPAIASIAATAILCAVAAFSQTNSPAPIRPSPFRSGDGKITEWKITIPGGRPLATPAIADGKIFVGGGFGSHEFYAFEAETGKLLWTYHTDDDGPTAAAVADGKIAFNTESCELEVLTTSGRRLWKKWLGDPLMSMPAIADDVVYMAFPNSRGDHKYYIAAFDLNTGAERWRHPLSAEIITAPVIDKDRLYLATVDGSAMALDRRNGVQIWQEQKNATSAPAVWNDRCFFSRREAVKLAGARPQGPQQTEMMVAYSKLEGVKDMRETRRDADYLDYQKNAQSAGEQKSQALDAAVGFATVKGSAAPIMARAQENLGKASVHGIWAYQGSKNFVDHGKVYASMGDRAQSVDPDSGKVIWSRVPAKGALTPPVIVNGKVFVGSDSGSLHAVSAKDGAELWSAQLGGSISFQPAISRGRIYVVTDQGVLYGLNTGDRADDGWLMWGGTAAHNGLSGSH